VQSRQQELQAIVEAISILNSDDARDNFGKTFAPSLLQAANVQRKQTKARLRVASTAASLLAAAALSSGDHNLAKLAVSVKQDDAFAQVKQAIDDMVKQLKKEQKDELKQRDTCTEELHDVELGTERQTRNKANVETRIATLESRITEMKTATKTIMEEVTEIKIDLKRAEEDRAMAFKEFKNILADQQETQRLLQKAIAVLKSAYAQKPKHQPLRLFVQVSGLQEPPAKIPEGFAKPYERSRAGSPVVALLEQILSEAVATQKEITATEDDERKAFENFVDTSNKAIKAKHDSLVDKNEDMAKAQQNLLQATNDLHTSLFELESLSKTEGALHMSCDFLLKNFEERRGARDEEIQALVQAKALISGMGSEE
jgi:chromosome segregation ATPase